MTNTDNTRPLVLVVDDERNSREGLVRALNRDYRVLSADGGAPALALLEQHPIDILLTDVRMPGMDGITLMRKALAAGRQPVCILITAYGSVDIAVEAMKQGAYDFLTKPVNLDRLELVMQRALRSRHVEDENRALREQLDTRFGMENMVGNSDAILRVFDTVRQVAPSRATVLITGESGSGKELIAGAIHRLSPRRDLPFIAVHCAALPENLIASELFGHEKGAFTGASERRQGRFERADGGTLFLDEIGEINPALQVNILRVLEERAFERVGGHETIETDVRLIAATNRDLRAMVREGSFREDLFFRLNVVEINMPPLRERRADIPLLAAHFLKSFAQENEKNIAGFTPEAMEVLTAYAWPGNIRELRNLVERMVVLGRSDKITLRDIPSHVRPESNPTTMEIPPGLTMRDAEHQMLLNALEENKHNRTEAARQLGISRRTLHRKIDQWGIPKKRTSNSSKPHG